MKQHEDDRKETGPSWWDVRRAQLELRKSWGGSCVVELTAVEPTGKPGDKALCIRVTHQARADGRPGAAMVASSYWPNIDHKTMPGLLLKLLWDLDWKLTEAKNIAERQTAF